MNIIDLAWLAGLLEGEGSFMKASPSNPTSPKVALQTTDEDVIAKAASLMGVRYYAVKPSQKALEHDWKPVFSTVVRGLSAVKLMEQLYPLMGVRRRSQIENAISTYSVKPWSVPCRKLTQEQVEEIKSKLDEGESQRVLAETYSVNTSTISRIKTGKFWSGEEKQTYKPILRQSFSGKM